MVDLYEFGKNLNINKAARILSCYKEGDSIRKALENDLEKAEGEGSRGGKVIGHTKSGKPIYENANHEGHKNFTIAEHNDAIDLHQKPRDDYHKNMYSTDDDKKKNDHHYEQQKEHISQKNALIREEDTKETHLAAVVDAHKKMKYQLKITRKSDSKVFVRNFKTKKEMQRFQSNNYATYTW